MYLDNKVLVFYHFM